MDPGFPEISRLRNSSGDTLAIPHADADFLNTLSDLFSATHFAVSYKACGWAVDSLVNQQILRAPRDILFMNTTLTMT